MYHNVAGEKMSAENRPALKISHKFLNKRILIVENDRVLLRSLTTYLVEKSYHCLGSSTLETAYHLIDRYSFDLVILDRVLDDGDGRELIPHLKEVSYPTKILVLSQKHQLEDRLDGLSQGADDYLGKPFSLRELLIKVDTLLRRQKMFPQDLLRVKDLSLYTEAALLCLGSQCKNIRRREADILACLMRHKNQVVSKQQIISSVWQNSPDVPTYTTVDVYIRRIRLHLGDKLHYLVTVRGLGYMIAD
jgi:two-component system, OmpR family, response regulator